MGCHSYYLARTFQRSACHDSLNDMDWYGRLVYELFSLGPHDTANGVQPHDRHFKAQYITLDVQWCCWRRCGVAAPKWKSDQLGLKRRRMNKDVHGFSWDGTIAFLQARVTCSCIQAAYWHHLQYLLFDVLPEQSEFCRFTSSVEIFVLGWSQQKSDHCLRATTTSSSIAEWCVAIIRLLRSCHLYLV